MLNGPDIRKLAVWLYNATPERFAKIYGKDPSEVYMQDKFRKMQAKPMAWIGELDSYHLERLAEEVNNGY